MCVLVKSYKTFYTICVYPINNMISNPLLLLLLKIIIFIAIIYTLQCGFEYLKTTYTKPKVKDLVNTQIKKYKEIMTEINNQEENKRLPSEDDDINNADSTFTQVNVDDMNSELLSFMNSQTQQFVTTA